jgi:ketosteroid isomerase-like protein
MSGGDAEAVVRQAYDEAWNTGDLEALVALADDEIILTTSGAFPDLEREYRGRDGIRRFWQDVRGPWEDLSVEVVSVAEHGDEILALLRFRARAREGMSVDMKFGQVGKMRDGLVTSIVSYPDWPSAAAAVGLELSALVPR